MGFRVPTGLRRVGRHDERDVNAMTVLHPSASVGVLENLRLGVHASELQPHDVPHRILDAETIAHHRVEDGHEHTLVRVVN